MFLLPAIALVTSLAAFASPFTGRAKSVNGQYQQSLMTVSSDFDELHDSIKSIPMTGSTMFHFMNFTSYAIAKPFASNVVTLTTSMYGAIAEAKNYRESTDSGSAEFIDQIQNIMTAHRSVVDAIIAKKDGFDSHFVGGAQFAVANAKAYSQKFMAAVTDGLPHSKYSVNSLILMLPPYNSDSTDENVGRAVADVPELVLLAFEMWTKTGPKMRQQKFDASSFASGIER
ncbi:hypothetical protein BU17DRAFT_66847 [Hysterangium stoloniferum]|nr:hypothetical protein BU17DRAFT_66847 [Hysterangium stoloniferum]